MEESVARYLGPVCKLCRREGEKLFLKGERCYNKCPMDKPNGAFAPGQHGKRRKKTTEFGKRLREKQKTKRIAGILERQFYGYFEKARHVSGQARPRSLVADARVPRRHVEPYPAVAVSDAPGVSTTR